ncbi:uncharacterized protein FIBRA_06130 [Fibroporia radiculosa]|uniref:Uncharacterized protein n=1 Tax=Fibroporia radiculosa TaxID=599839 RepID=J4H3W9_9APHY|nr:uncharacterized protein FIBRA_06130 [Fibroporia radiculosa]CCM03974.1 predicted protein [Fibroporia radiculosa]
MAHLVRNPHTNIAVDRDYSPCISGRASLSTSSANYESPAIASRPPRSTPEHPLLSPSSSEGRLSSLSLTAAQISRASAQAVRLCARDGKFGDALYLVNSLRSSTNQDDVLVEEKQNLHHSKSRTVAHMKPIDFGQVVSARLSAHSFLHGLVRAGYSKKAARYAEMMMEHGIRIRETTTNTIIVSLSSNLATSLNGNLLANTVRRPRIRDGPEVLELREMVIGDRCTRAAVQLLGKARMWGQCRSQRMYDNAISGCLMQGEIIVASLLFVLLVKDWQLRQSLAKSLGSDAAEEEPFTSPITQRHIPRIPREDRMQLPYPSIQMMSTILNAVKESLSRDPQDSPGHDPQSSLQALANLAILLDTGQLHTGSIAALIHALYSCPKGDHLIWIREREQARPKRVKAYPYFQRVLMRLIDSLYDPAVVASRLRLDLRSYNALLFYSLRHRLSSTLASRVLDHMCMHRNPPLQPNIVTYNILLRSGTLVRRMDLSETALAALRAHKLNASHGIMVEADQSQLKPKRVSKTVLVSGPLGFSTTLHQLQNAPFHVPALLQKPSNDVAADAFTLGSYIMHLTSTGSPEVVADILFFILPELRTVSHPSWGALTPEQRDAIRYESREASLRRAVQLGPHVFAALINSLAKAGKPGLAERVWLLAKQGEAASWIPNFAPEFSPWYLPVHAYTSMLQCYAKQARRASSILRCGQNRAMHSLMENPGDWKPGSRPVRGWAGFVHATRQAQTGKVTRRTRSGERAALILYGSMQSGGEAVYSSLLALHQRAQEPSSHVVVPSPDARFFNAALELFGHHPHRPSRAKRRSRSSWRHALRIATTRYEHEGIVSPLWNKALQQVMEGMVAAGFDIPIGYRNLSIGHWISSAQRPEHTPQTLTRRPYAFPPVRRRFLPHSLSIAKTRGLPVRPPHRVHRRQAWR